MPPLETAYSTRDDYRSSPYEAHTDVTAFNIQRFDAQTA